MTDQSFNQGPDAPATPTNLRTTSTYATSTAVAWDAVTEATSYEVWLTDTQQTNPQPVKTPVLAGTAYTAAGLLPARTYRIQVYSVLDKDGLRLLSTAPAEKNTLTESIIIEDIVKNPAPNEPICPLTCSTVTVDTSGIVRWSAFVARDFHKIRIKARVGGTVMAQAVLERDRTTAGVRRIRNLTSLICDGTQLAIHPPAKTACPTGTPPLSWCGTFPQNSQTVGYRIEADIDKCVVRLLSPANIADYIIEAERCTTLPRE